MAARHVCALMIISLAFGCGSGAPAPAPSVSPAVSSADQLKERLKYVAESGTGGSALAGMPEMIEKTDKSLMPDFQALERAQTPDQVKAAAKKLLDKLK